jgi:predicted methyltransferase
MKTYVLLSLSLVLCAPVIAREAAVPARVATAFADPARPAEQRARDAARHPEKLLAFARIKPGDTVVDFVMGGGYWTHLLASVVGPKGVVYAFQPLEFVGFRAAYGTEQDAVAQVRSNVRPVRTGFGAPEISGPVDAIITVQNYHDMHLKPFPADTAQKANAKLFSMLKRGGTLVVVDHVAASGSGLEAANALHRIDPAIVRQELEAAGFRFDGELDAWRNADDPHTASAFDPTIRGKTDQFAYRFRKPR